MMGPTGQLETVFQCRRLPVGAEPVPQGGAHFRVWAPAAERVDVVLEGGPGAPAVIGLDAEPKGYFSGLAREAGPGTLYRYRLFPGSHLYPDPASRYQPAGPHGPSQIVDPGAFAWTDDGWPGVRLPGQVLYEMHIGTFTPEGTWAAAARELPELRRAGLTVLEIMPVAEFPGRFGWGYDGVALYAPTRLYGTPDDLRQFVDRAHALGLGVILDVVYNHMGPEGCYLKEFSSQYRTDRYPNEWGEPLNFDGPGSDAVREFFVSNAGYWIGEFHFDGLRLDATQNIHDASRDHVIAVIVRQAREAAQGRDVIIVAENEPQDTRLVETPGANGFGADALCNDDFHHAARVALTGCREGYYTDYLGTPQELMSAVKWGFLYQGQRYSWQNKPRGTPAFGLPPASFIVFLQNHDQVANSPRGERLHRLADPGAHRALTALLCLAPSTPMLFQGQEFGASSPWLYFADHAGELGRQVRKGRVEFLAQFPSIAGAPEQIADPLDPATFQRCKLNPAERDPQAPMYALHRDLLALRREDPVFRSQQPRAVDGAQLGPQSLLLRFFGGTAGDRLLLLNLGADIRLDQAPEPLLAPPRRGAWRLLWSSEDPRYGGRGTPPIVTDAGWYLPGHAAVVLGPAFAPDRATGD
jgi:maltooligosyltrehalose trehalohydrolase